MKLSLSSHRIFRMHISIILFLTLASLSGHVIHFTTGHDFIFGLRPLFNMDGEMNIPALFSAFAILCSALLLFALYYAYRQSRMRGSGFFLTIGFLFLYLAYDEALSVHEHLSELVNHWVPDSGLLYRQWVVPGVLFVLLVFLYSLSFLKRTDVGTRNLMVLSGAIFVGGAIGCEALAGLYWDSAELTWEMLYGSQPDMIYWTLATCEESMEMFGIALFVFTLIKHYERNFGTCSIRINWVSLQEQHKQAT